MSDASALLCSLPRMRFSSTAGHRNGGGLGLASRDGSIWHGRTLQQARRRTHRLQRATREP